LPINGTIISEHLKKAAQFPTIEKTLRYCRTKKRETDKAVMQTAVKCLLWNFIIDYPYFKGGEYS
jgi:hypothetical protein